MVEKMTKVAFPDKESITSLLRVTCYRGFLGLYLSPRGRKAQLCRKAGFSSRSYLSEIIAGKKGLSRDSFQRIKGALGSSSLWVNFFECLVWKSELSLRPKHFSHETNENKLNLLRSSLLQVSLQSHSTQDSKGAIRCVGQPQLFQVYAALGSENKGANMQEIIGRTRLNALTVEKYLRRLLMMEVIYENNGRYYAPVNKSDALTIKNPQTISNLMGQVCKKIYQDRDRIARESNSMVVYSAFSVSRQQMEIIKERLSSVIFEVLDEFQDDDGDGVQQLFISVFDNPF
jgi:hypothetical protein